MKFAEIDPEGFYIYSFPGLMEVTALFRPHTLISEGLIKQFDVPRDAFYAAEGGDLIMFLGKEPNLGWEDFADCIFCLCDDLDVEEIFFIGSVAGPVPHTREPRLFCSASGAHYIEAFKHYGIKYTNYDGPASIVTYLTAHCGDRGLNMVNLVATVPAYVQGNNPKCIGAVTRRLAGILRVDLDMGLLDAQGEAFEKKLANAVAEQPELAGSIQKLEEDYDNDIFNNEMGDLKDWLEEQGIQLD
jgi:proteasome assembly chaperone (PAC2) family protein